MNQLRSEETKTRLTVFFTAHKIWDEKAISEIGAELRQLCKHAAATGKRRIVVDFQGVVAMSSAVIGKLVLLNLNARKNGLVLRLSNVSQGVMDVFEMVKLNKVFMINARDDGDDDVEGIGCGVPIPKSPKTDVARAEPPQESA